MLSTGINKILNVDRKFISAFFSACLLSILTFSAMIGTAMSQTVPSDFAVELSSNVRQPGYPFPPEVVTISSSGEVTYSEMERKDGMLPAESVQISSDAVATIYAAVNSDDFFALKERYESPAVDDGDYAELKITANGQTHTVVTVNMRVNAFDRIVKTINRQLPTERWIIYNALHVEDHLEVER